jgi:aspartyl-tRNA(Asn)/glutamyl-tRNA(Gln) amidotransferase subunit C
MVTEKDIAHIAELADLGIESGELGTFTHQFNDILEYFDILDQVPEGGPVPRELVNVMREDVVEPSLPHEDVVRNAGASEDGFIKAPRVM